MPAGAKRLRIVVQESTPAPDDAGQLVPTWATWCERWAEAQAIGGGEDVENRQLQPAARWRLTLWSDAATRGITPRMRVVTLDGRALNIGRVYDPDGRRREIVLECTEKPA